MNLRQAQEQLMSKLLPNLSQFGFSRAQEWSFSRCAGDLIHNTLSFGVKAKELGGFSFACGAGVRFESVERLIGRSDDNKYKATIGMPIHLLGGTGVYEEWFFSERAQLKALVPEVIGEITTCALPFFEKFSTLDHVRAQLESESPANWFTLNPETRIKVLTGILFVQEGPRSALSFLSSALEATSTQPLLFKGDLMLVKRRLEGRLSAIS